MALQKLIALSSLRRAGLGRLGAAGVSMWGGGRDPDSGLCVPNPAMGDCI